MHRALRSSILAIMAVFASAGAALACPQGYHQRGTLCVQDVRCPAGYHASSLGVCMATFKCLTGFQATAAGCVKQVLCPIGTREMGGGCVNKTIPGPH